MGMRIAQHGKLMSLIFAVRQRAAGDFTRVQCWGKANCGCGNALSVDCSTISLLITNQEMDWEIMDGHPSVFIKSFKDESSVVCSISFLLFTLFRLPNLSATQLLGIYPPHSFNSLFSHPDNNLHLTASSHLISHFSFQALQPPYRLLIDETSTKTPLSCHPSALQLA